jgi:hypothetical protein
MSQQSVLSGIIAGEAGNPADQFGVASTIYNRTQGASGYTGYGFGLDAFSAAANHNQFEAYPNRLGQTTPYTDSLAAALLNGTLPSMGNTGNSTFYNAPGSNAAYASGSGNNYGAGTNQYSDGYNQPPSANFVLPSAGGTNGGGAIPNGPTTDPGFGGGDYLTMNPSDPNYGDITGLPVAGVNAPAASTTTSPSTTSPSTTSPTTSPSAGPQGTQIQTALQPEESSFITSTVQGVEKAMGAGLAATLKAAENGLGTYFAGISNWFVRAGLIILAIVLIAIGLIVLMWDHGGKETAGRMMEVMAA